MDSEHGKCISELELADRVHRTVPINAFISLKDHKENFQNNPQSRLLNPTKPEIGKISMKILDNIVKSIRSKKNLTQWTNTKDVINWFKSIENKQRMKFIQFDIVSFYPSISPTLLENALSWAAKMVELTPQQRKIIFQSRKSFLYVDGKPWVKKGENNFDVGMGSYDGAQVCELVGLYLLSQMTHLTNFTPGLYRDDGLGFTPASVRQQTKIKDEITKIFTANNLKITCDINRTSVNFLDVTLDLKTSIFKPYIKPGDKPLYVNAASNHPPAILRNIPIGINKRLSEISSSQEVFHLAAPLYQAELDRCGYNHKLEYSPPSSDQQPKKKNNNNKNRVTWFNPPYSLNVETNVGKIFLELLDLHFPPGHVLRSVMNRNCVKISYRCLPNMGSHISRHNSKILREEDKNQEKPPPKCNCQISKKDQCPIPGACNQKGVIYQAKVTSQGGKNTQTYVGLAKDFKARYSKHKTSLENPSPDNSTTLSTYFLKEEAAGNNPSLSWKFLKTNIPAFNPVTGTCRLCLSEKYHILFKPECATLNSRSEIFTSCRHKKSELLVPPDPKSQGG